MNKPKKVIAAADVRSVDVWNWPAVQHHAADKNRSKSRDVAASSLRPPTAGQLDKINEQARLDGFSSGYKKGMEEGTAEGLKRTETEMNRRLAVLEGLLVAFQTPLGIVENTLAEQIQLLVRATCETILEREVSADAGALETMVTRALSALNSGEHKITITCDSESCKRLLSFQENGILDGSIKLTADPKLAHGAITVSTRNSGVQAGWRDRLGKLLTEVFQPLTEN